MIHWRNDSCEHDRRFRIERGYVLSVCKKCGQVENGKDGQRAMFRYAPEWFLRRAAEYL